MPPRDSNPLTLDTSVQYLRGVGPRRADQLAELGVRTVEDLLYHVPTRYEDYGSLCPLALVQPGSHAVVRGAVIDLKFRSGRLPRFEICLQDDSGTALVTWFNGRWLIGKVNTGDTLLITGKSDQLNGRLRFVNPKFRHAEPGADENTGGVVPIYPAGAGLESRHIAAIVRNALPRAAGLPAELFNPAHRGERELPALADALRAVHAPHSPKEAAAGRRRLAYDELFVLEAGVALKRAVTATGKARPIPTNPELDARIRARFPFPLTPAQDRAATGIIADMRRSVPMNRLLQGDVGSGKTVVALYAALAAVANGFQAAIMAPTEILAEQHYRNVRTYLDGSRVRMRLLAGGLPPAFRRDRLRAVAAGEIDLVVGTQALVEEDVRFHDLALVVVDEQHKFGVLQRAAFRSKGLDPHYLVMTATPIPRTLALSFFGDLDVSIIDELPPGRQAVKTQVVGPEREKPTFEFVRKKLAAGDQAYVVCPLIDESEKSDLKAAVAEAERLQRDVFPEFKVVCLHGRMSREEKDAAMAGFVAGRSHVLVSTVVIEVGVDVPNATVMLVRHAERFGLSQLHQLRGRIGRGRKPATCLLFCETPPAQSDTDDSLRRLDVMTRTTDGFVIAEEDLRIRGPGEFFGTRQHGLPALRVANLSTDLELLQLARRDAFALVERDPRLANPANAEIRRRLKATFGKALDLIRAG
jgi:ATP-dependent DNA helicase RecG